MKRITDTPPGKNIIAWTGLVAIALLAALPVDHTISIVLFGERSLVGETLAMILTLLGLASALFFWLETPTSKDL